MVFNSLQFAVFFVIVYSLYLVLNHKWQNRMLLVASCIFYGAWDWRFLLLMFVSITSDYYCAIKIYESNDEKVRKLFLFLNMFISLSILGFFKYFNFFAVNLERLINCFGFHINFNVLNVILPVGISFYTFQAMSYAFDVYRRQLVPTKRFLDYSLFVTFFPQLVAGPIMRAADLLPQVLARRKVTWDKFYQGCYMVFWGLFMKIFVADNLATLIVDPVFTSQPPYNGVKVLLGLYAFVIQVYCDFAGYSVIAMGLGKLMGFDIMVNFNQPLLATNIQDFWRRWHISLSSWLKDYLYIPLGGSRKGNIRTSINLMITMIAVGFWHGAAWHFIAFGVIEGCLLVLYRILKPKIENFIKPRSSFWQNLWLAVRILFMFQITSIAFMFFRAQYMSQILSMFKSLITNFQFTHGIGLKYMSLNILFFSWLVILAEIIQYRENDMLAMLKKKAVIKTIFFYTALILMMIFGNLGQSRFVYFQF